MYFPLPKASSSMKVKHLIEENSLLCHFVAEMRDIEIQKDAMRFRRNVERVGEIMAYELSKKLQLYGA